MSDPSNTQEVSTPEADAKIYELDVVEQRNDVLSSFFKTGVDGAFLICFSTELSSSLAKAGVVYFAVMALRNARNLHSEIKGYRSIKSQFDRQGTE
jgi:hypothetical protein